MSPGFPTRPYQPNVQRYSAMKFVNIIGIVLIVLGALALTYQGITYVTDETVVDIGPLEVEAEKKETIPVPPILGVIAIAGGIGMVIYGRKQ